MEKLNSYLTFKIGKEYFAANTSFVHNIIEIPTITKLPEMPSFMLGVINLRGKVLPVIDSRIKFGIENTEITTNTCIIVMEISINTELAFVGMMVDAVAEVAEIKQTNIKEPPSAVISVDNNYINGIFYNNEKFTMILNLKTIFNSTEILRLNNSKYPVKN